MAKLQKGIKVFYFVISAIFHNVLAEPYIAMPPMVEKLSMTQTRKNYGEGNTSQGGSRKFSR